MSNPHEGYAMKLNRGINNLFLIATMCSGICGWAQGPIHQNNAAFLGHVRATTASYINAHVSTDASNLQFSYGTNVLFVNCGTINSSGQLTNGAASAP